MKRVLILIKGLGRGGAEQLLVNAARYSSKDRFDYEVAYLLPFKNALVGELEEQGLRVHCLDGSRGVGWMGRLRDVVRRRNIDVVHAHLPYSAIGARLSLRGRNSPRFVYTEHNIWQRYHRATYWGNLLTFPRNDHVFAVSDHVKESIRYPAFARLEMPPVETLYHGTDPRLVTPPRDRETMRHELGIPDGAPVIGTVANFKTHKGHRYLVEAAVEVVRELPDVRFVLVGVGPLEERIKRQAEQAGVAGSMIFAGFRDDAPELAAIFDVFTLPSLHEGLSIALIEAMAQGVPAVVTRAGGLPEVLHHGSQGFLVPPRDPHALASSLIRLLGDRDLRTRFGMAARERAAYFDIRNAVARMEQVYEELTA
jgi:glycosyltransferase involved in cell wall biosynthesis